MIEWLLLQDFQGHRRLRVALDPRVTTLVGDTEHGKSSILRALRWWATNKGRVKGFLGRFGKARRTAVTGKADGVVVTRARGKGNTYKVGKARPLKAVGGKGGRPPKSVDDLLNVGDVNFQGQLDAPFWFTLPAPEVSRQLNSVVNLSAIDAALAKAAREVRRVESEKEVCRGRLKDARGRRRGLAWAVEAAAAVRRADRLWDRHRRICARRAALLCHFEKATRLAETKRHTTAAILYARRAANAARRAVRLKARADRLRGLLGQCQRLRGVLALPGATIARAGRLTRQLMVLQERRRRLASLWLAAKNLEYERCQLDNKIKGLTNVIRRAARGRCPACGQRLPSRSRSTSRTPTSPSGPRRAGGRPDRSGSTPRPGTSDNSETLYEALERSQSS